MKSRIASFFGNNVKAFSVAVRTVIVAALIAASAAGCGVADDPPIDKLRFYIPAAPATPDVTPLPESFDASTLVTPYYEYMQDGGMIGDTPYYITLPSIYPFSEDAVTCQQDIYISVFPTMEYYATNTGYRNTGDTVVQSPFEDVENENDPDGIGYEVHLYDNILTIVVWTKLPTDPTEHYIFALDISTGERLSEFAMRSRLGITDEDVRQFLEKTLSDKYPWYFPNGGINPADATDPQRRLLRMLSEENVANSQVFITEDGSIYVAANVYALAGAEYYSQLLPYKPAAPATD